MKCPYCNEFKGNSKVRGYPVKDQLWRHIEVDHIDKLNRVESPADAYYKMEIEMEKEYYKELK